MLEHLENSNVPTAVLDDARGLILSPTEIMNPVGGEVIEVTDTDSLIGAYESLVKVSNQLWACQLLIRSLFKDLATEGEGKTRRVAGNERAVIVKLPDDKWENAELREAWDKFPKFRESYLRIAKVEPQLRELKKLASTNGEDDLMQFKRKVFGAKSVSTALPTIEIVK